MNIKFSQNVLQNEYKMIIIMNIKIWGKWTSRKHKMNIVKNKIAIKIVFKNEHQQKS